MNQNLKKPEQILQMMQILCAAMLTTVFIFSVVLFIEVKPVFNTQIFVETIRSPLHLVLFFMGALFLLARAQISNWVFGKMIDQLKPTDTISLLKIYFIPFVLRITLAESAALMGFLSSFMSGEGSAFVILATSAALAIVKELPTEEKVKEKLKIVRPRIQILN